MLSQLKKDFSEMVFATLILMVMTFLTIVSNTMGILHSLGLNRKSIEIFTFISVILLCVFACSIICFSFKKTVTYSSRLFLIPIFISGILCLSIILWINGLIF